MSKTDFTKTVVTLVQEKLGSLGFQKRKYGIMVMAVSEDVIGLVGLNTAHGRGPGILEINPVVGVRNQRVERLVADLLGRPYDEVNPYSAGVHVGYLSPESRYHPYVFEQSAPVDDLANELVDAIRKYGLPFFRSNVTLPALLETMRRRGIAIVTVYRIPVVLHLLGRSAEANTFLSEELAKIGAQTDPASEQLRRFADRFKEWSRTPAVQ